MESHLSLSLSLYFLKAFKITKAPKSSTIKSHEIKLRQVLLHKVY